ncbi:hypothetical protein IFM47457_09558 [Aspergillus lentulus]|nr:hypothetical protein IFM47457_09558 [Aspergillus lentulus]
MDRLKSAIYVDGMEAGCSAGEVHHEHQVRVNNKELWRPKPGSYCDTAYIEVDGLCENHPNQEEVL